MTEWVLVIRRPASPPDSDQHHHIGEEIGYRVHRVGDQGTAFPEDAGQQFESDQNNVNQRSDQRDISTGCI